MAINSPEYRFWLRNKDRLLQEAKDKRKLEAVNPCCCGCGTLVRKKWVWGHNVKVNPTPQNLGKYIKGMKGKNSPNWKGGHYLNDGYSYLYYPNHPNSTKSGYILEHRLVMEVYIGRFLEKQEVVHHIDHNKLNNDTNNLILCENQKEHNLLHKKIINELGQYVPTEK